MRHLSLSGERRLGGRRAPHGSRLVFWGQPAEPSDVRGWLRDVSPGGIGFVTARAERPVVGERIELRPARGHNQLLCRVVRVAEGEDDSLVVGCELASGGPAPAARALPVAPLMAAIAASRRAHFAAGGAAAAPPVTAGHYLCPDRNAAAA